MIKIEKYKKLLVVVDMVNEFIKEGKMSDKDINHITPKIKSSIEESLSEDEAVAFIKDVYIKNSIELKRYLEHCIDKTNECELISELASYEKNSSIYRKKFISTIFASNFIRDIERMKSLEEVVITGCSRDICVMNLAIPLVNYFDEHDRYEYNRVALRLMKNQGIGVENI